ncbi:MAG: ATP-dependent DNA helicase RecQ [Deltaproteobacteria bacterium]|nr:ATP-dependent DNA helicase RecQ [Deltaproteobacteria bacterium]
MYATRWAQLKGKARKVFGVERIRTGQAEVLEALMAGKHVMAIMPTGSGKSLCYQLATLALPGTTVIVSPLISLMKDQTGKLRAIGLSAAQINSTLTVRERAEDLDAIEQHQVDFIFTTPEQLADSEFVSTLRRGGIDMLVIDEAHCISEWGHDFRPSYLLLQNAIKTLGDPQVLALTATATEEVIADIRLQLGLPDLVVVNTGILRPNLYFEVIRTVNEQEKLSHVARLLQHVNGSSIVYCSTVRNVETVFAYLKQRGESSERYHGKLKTAERNRVQDDFMAGRVRVIVATNAFGMGIDKPDIRLVIHFNVPASLEEYYQESGRAGRDRGAAQCVLLYQLADRRVHSFLMLGRYPSIEEVHAVYQELKRVQRRESSTALDAIEHGAQLGRRKTRVILSMFKRAGKLRQTRDNRFRLIGDDLTNENLQQLATEYEDRGNRDQAKLERMMLYGQVGSCRWKFLLDYFGEQSDWDHCGHCDNCRIPPETRIGTPSPN